MNTLPDPGRPADSPVHRRAQARVRTRAQVARVGVMIRTVTAIFVAGLAAAAFSGAALAASPAPVPAPGPTPDPAPGPTSASAPPLPRFGLPQFGLPQFGLPLAGEPRIMHRFTAPSAPWGPGHRGVDLAADVAAVVLAPRSGTVTFAGTVVDRGIVTVSHGDGLRSSLEPLEWSVHAGDRVERGEPIGVVQAVPGHCAPATCLHWGVRRGETYVDPLALVARARPGPVVLLPDP